MENKYVTITQLSYLSNIFLQSLSSNLKKELKKTSAENYRIDIDKFLIKRKLYNFKFLFEINNTSFLDRCVVEVNENTWINAAQVKDLLKIDDYKLSILRNNESIISNQIRRTKYEYSLISINEYCKKNNIEMEPKFLEYSKQFYTPLEVKGILEKKGIELSLKSIYRYINNYNKIPAVRICGNLRIPILEFNYYVIEKLPEIFK